MATLIHSIGTKAVARQVSTQTGISYSQARTHVNAAIADLRIQRLRYNDNLRNWEIDPAQARALVRMLVEQITT